MRIQHSWVRLAAAIGVVVALSLTLRGQEGAPLSPTGVDIDKLLAGVYGPNDPGATAIVVKDGRILLRKAYGLASVELRTPLVPESVMAVASLTKQITAASMLILAQDGKLSVSDDVTKFLPAYSTHGRKVTIEHLMTHTSGVNALIESSDYRAVATQEGKLAENLADWTKDLPPDAEPGEQWAYSNVGYNLLGAVIEQVSGMAYSEFVTRRIFEPLGMTHTYYDDKRAIIPLRASGYEIVAGTPFNVLSPRSRVLHPRAAGGLLSTVDDLARWDEALHGERVLSAESKRRMFTAFRLKNGTSTNYGYGWDLGSYEGHRVQEHAGGLTGFVSHMVRMPDDRVFVLILSNRNSMMVPIQTTAHRVGALAVGRPIADPIAVAVPSGQLDRLTGTFEGADIGRFTVTREGERFQANVPGFEPIDLVPVAPLTFRSRMVTWTFRFEADDAGAATLVRVNDWKLADVAKKVVPVEAKARTEYTATGTELDACAGEYEQLGGLIVRVVRTGASLELRPFAQAAVALTPAGSRAFVSADGAVQYAFTVDARGVVTGYLRTSGLRAVPARRLGLATPAVSSLLLVSEDEAKALRAAATGTGTAVSPALARWRQQADRRLTEGPWSVTSARPKDTTAGPHDFFSEGPYWWPDPKNPKGPYIRRDGEVNPDRFTANDRDMSAMAEAVCDLGVAAYVFDDARYAGHAARILRTWFVEPQTRMNPNLEFGQAIRGVSTGRGIGIIDSSTLIWAVQGMTFLERSGRWPASERDAVRAWFADYVKWLTTSQKGLDEKRNGNNHSTWWAAQVAAYATFVGNESIQTMVWNFYRDVLVPGELRADGSAPEEEARTKSLGYSAMNLNAFSLICRLADRRGINLWTYQAPSGASVLKAVSYLAPFVQAPETWRKPQIAPYHPDQAYFLALFGQGLDRPEWLESYRRLAKPGGSWSRLLHLLVFP